MPEATEKNLDRNDYRVEIRDQGGWSVHILDPAGESVFTRPCSDQGDAETFASTVRQHIDWLSPPKFRSYYRIPEPE